MKHSKELKAGFAALSIPAICLLVCTAAIEPAIAQSNEASNATQDLVSGNVSSGSSNRQEKAAYENPRPVSSASLLPAAALNGPDYRVGPEADPTGMLYNFSITSQYENYNPQSLQMTRIRLIELRAINRLTQLAQEPMFLDGVGEQVGDTLEAAGSAIGHPVQTVRSIPLGFKKFVGGIQADVEVGRVYGESGNAGAAKVKRELAYNLGVDPYSSNKTLQDLLNRVSVNTNRGKLVTKVGTFFVGGALGTTIQAVNLTDTFQEAIRNKSAAELQVDNQKALLTIGCPLPDVQRFLTMPGYTAANCTAISMAMSSLGSVRGVPGFINNLPAYAGPESVLFSQTQIQMAAQFNATQHQLSNVRFVGATPVWSDQAGHMYVFSPLEYVYWNEEIDSGLANIHKELGVTQTEFWVGGKVSKTASDQLSGRGVIVKQDALKLLWPGI